MTAQQFCCKSASRDGLAVSRARRCLRNNISLSWRHCIFASARTRIFCTLPRTIFGGRHMTTLAAICGGFPRSIATLAFLACVSMLATWPVHADTVSEAITGCEQTQDLDLQIKACTTLLEVLSPEAKPHLYMTRGNAYADKKEFNKAIGDYTQLIAIDPAQKEGYLNRGIAYMQMQAADKALVDFQKVVEIDANFADGYYQRGIAHDALSASESAIADLERAVALAPNEKRYTSALATIRTLNLAPAPAAPQTGAPAGQGQRLVISPSSIYPALASPEMLPALKPGDEIELTPYTGSPRAGDIVAFKVPVDGKTIVARRVIGLPGDEVVLGTGRVLLNGMALVRMPDETAGVAGSYRETLPNGMQYVVIDKGTAVTGTLSSMRVPAGHYLVVGDNRDYSLDFRSWGFGYVPEADIVGRVQKAGAPAPPSTAPAPPQAEPTSASEKPGWLSWLWSADKPNDEKPAGNASQAVPPVATPAVPNTWTTTQTNYLGKQVEVALPSGFCLAESDDAIIARVVELKAKQFPVLVLAGFKDCDVAKGSFRNRYGIAFGLNEPRLTSPDADLGAKMKTWVSDMCVELQTSSMGNGFPAGALSNLGPDASQVAVINAKAAEALQGPHEAIVSNFGALGLRNDVCYSAELWMTSDGKNRKAMFGVFALTNIKGLPVILTVYEQILSTDSARQLTERVAAAVDRMRELNGQ